MLLHLASFLDVPLRERNVLLAAAGFAPSFAERRFSDPAIGVIRANLEAMLAAHDPNPAMVVDRHWIMLAANLAVAHLVAGAEGLLLRPPVNILRLFLHPVGLAPRIVNLGQWRAQVMARLRQQIDLSGDPVLMDLLDEIRDYPTPPCLGSTEAEPGSIAVPFRLATIDGVLSFFATTTRFAAPLDITVSELTLETFLPADAETASLMRSVVEQRDSHGAIRPEAVALV
jgi:hypothetical protein